ncbi:hypothetical protein ZIOFF_008763 [Zingiber officinale]|uniref:Uncharacterized protein n=1 Tax=Zingiber officinale TaxID=94328 RepID=A0A8J5HZC3_ZINOF|nr:hypothetical protein ZIOFF_008763 [Zingiber officinale]
MELIKTSSRITKKKKENTKQKSLNASDDRGPSISINLSPNCSYAETMTLKSVLRVLQDVFPQVRRRLRRSFAAPQIDLRILRAVAVEFFQDVDGAVEFVLTDVLPIIDEPTEPPYDPCIAFDVLQPPNQVGGHSHVEGANEVNCHSDTVAETKNLLLSEPKTELEMDLVTKHKNNAQPVPDMHSSLLSEPNTVVLEMDLVTKHSSNSQPDMLSLDVMLFGNSSDVNTLPMDEVLEAKMDEHKSNVHAGVHSLDLFSINSSHILYKDEMLDRELNQIGKSLETNFLQNSGTKCQFLDATSVQGHFNTNVDDTIGASECTSVVSSGAFQHIQDATECEAETKNDLNSCCMHYEEQSFGSYNCEVKIKDKSICEDNNSLPAAFANVKKFPSTHEISQDLLCRISGVQCSPLSPDDFEVHESEHLSVNGVGVLPCDNKNLSAIDELQEKVATVEDTFNIDFLNGVLEAQNKNLPFADQPPLQKTLASALNLANEMLREVKLHKERALLAKREASTASQDVLEKVEELRHMITCARATNDKKAEDIRAETFSLAYQSSELLSQLNLISGEIEKYLSIVHKLAAKFIHSLMSGKLWCEMIQAEPVIEIDISVSDASSKYASSSSSLLERSTPFVGMTETAHTNAQLVAAKEKQAEAEKEKLAKETLAHKILNKQEGIMDSLAKEASQIQKEAEKNAKLWDFLMDRGRTLDNLYGEIFDAFKDVLFLQDSVDGRMPNNTSKCSTFEKNILSGGTRHSVLNEKTTTIDEAAYRIDKKEHSDDDWEMVEDEAELLS